MSNCHRASMALISLMPLIICSCTWRKTDPSIDVPAPVYNCHQEEFLSEQVRRIVILSPENASDTNSQLASDLQHVLAEAIRNRGLYEVIEVPRESSPSACKAWIKAGEYPVILLVQMIQKYNADAVLFVSVNRVQPVAPVSVGLSMRLVDTREGVTISSIDGYWSMNNPAILNRAITANANSLASLDAQLIANSFRALLGIVGEDIATEFGQQNYDFTLEPGETPE